ncbi:glycerophosphodiester phosphodiesterase family protein [Streptococcus mutans]|uniref:glycerophosphodiester phosphodiesterase family protein n=1 Tax=Streptococcus mutans TaxID=1309 RepID=UPI0038B97884
MKIKRYFPPKRQVYSLLKMLFLQITVSENGYSTKMTSFDDYLTKANQLEQKLLIEIKTSSTKANGYTMEYFSLDQNFMTKLLTNHKKIYAWTVNNESVMTGMNLMGVNGIITDYLTTSQGGKQR